MSNTARRSDLQGISLQERPMRDADENGMVWYFPLNIAFAELSIDHSEMSLEEAIIVNPESDLSTR